MSKYIHTPISPLAISTEITISNFLKEMAKTSFQGKNLGIAAAIWSEMLRTNTRIFLGLAGAMVPAGMRKVIVYLIENRMIDCLVSTGANLFHDLHESLGNFHYQGTNQVNDNKLWEEGIDRIYDVFAKDSEFTKADEFIIEFSERLELDRAYSTREYFFLLGKRLLEIDGEEGILTSAAKANLPIYCPAIGDSSFGLALGAQRIEKKGEFFFDIIKDIVEISQIITSPNVSGIIIVAGGTPKNFIQQAELQAELLNSTLSKRLSTGYKYAIQITTDSPHWGGLSGCTFEEGQSWGKINQQAEKVTVYCDATIALPVLVTAVAERNIDILKKRIKPTFILEKELKIL